MTRFCQPPSDLGMYVDLALEGEAFTFEVGVAGPWGGSCETYTGRVQEAGDSLSFEASQVRTFYYGAVDSDPTESIEVTDKRFSGQRLPGGALQVDFEGRIYRLDPV